MTGGPVRTLAIISGDLTIATPALSYTSPPGLKTVVTCVTFAVTDVNSEHIFTFSIGPGAAQPTLISSLGVTRRSVTDTVGDILSTATELVQVRCEVFQGRWVIEPGVSATATFDSPGGAEGRVHVAGYTLTLP